MDKMKKNISVVLGTYNRLPFLRMTIESIRSELCDSSYEIIVVDGGSTDGTIQWLVKQKDIILILQHNRGTWKGQKIGGRSWGYFMNLGFKSAQGTYICMVSDDCLIHPGAITEGVKLFQKEINQGNKIGAVAFYWRNWPEEENYHVGLTLGTRIFVNHGLYLREALQNVGFISEDEYGFYFADGDLCLKLWAKGYSCIDSKASFIEHYSHANLSARSSNSSTEKHDLEKYIAKWGCEFKPMETEDLTMVRTGNNPAMMQKLQKVHTFYKIQSLFTKLRSKANWRASR